MDKLPPEISDNEILKTVHDKVEDFLREDTQSEASSLKLNLESDQQNPTSIPTLDCDSCKPQEQKLEVNVEATVTDPSQDVGSAPQESSGSSTGSSTGVAVPSQSSEYGSGSLNPSRSRREAETETIEQFVPGVYVTLIVRPNGTKLFKRVRFRYKCYFTIQQTQHF